MALTDAKVKAAKLKDGKKQMKLADSDGLYLLVKPAGKYWRFDYSYGGKRKTLAIGVYPNVSLVAARDKRRDAERLLEKHIDPNQHKRNEKQKEKAKMRAATFKGIALEWFEDYKKHISEGHAQTIIRRLEREVFPVIGGYPIEAIKPREVLKLLQGIADRGAEETARRIKSLCSQVFCYAILHHDLEIDPTQPLKKFLSKKDVKHMPTITDPKKVGALMRAIQSFEGTHVVQCALKLAPLVFVRPTELRHAEWSEIDLEAAEWRIPAEKMKMGAAHIVPLSKQALAILNEIKLFTGEGKYVFPSIRTALRPMSENTINVALRRLGYSKDEMCGHGFRGMASTLLHEQGYPSDVIERQLAHKEGNAIKAAYNHARHLPERKAMMQAWADYLDALRDGAQVVPIHRVKA
jgi:integrase